VATVEASQTPGGPYATLASNVTAGTYADTGVANGTPYYFIVTATINNAQSAPSPEAAATALAPASASVSGAQYGYRDDGLRAWKQTEAGRVYFVYDGGVPVAEMDSGGNLVAMNTVGATGLLTRATATAGQPTSPTPTFYTFDPNGSVTERTDATGTVTTADVYDAYGGGANAPPDPFGYGAQFGYYTDAETGLTLCGRRYYDSETGRWLTRDPIGYAGGLNLYAYCSNGPAGGADPSGFDEEEERDDQIIVTSIQTTTTILGGIGGGLAGGAGGAVVGVGVGAIPGEMAGAAVGAAVGSAFGWLVGNAAVLVKHAVVDSSAGPNTDAAPDDSCPFANDGESPAQTDPGEFPHTPEEMDKQMGFEGERIPDRPDTPGRNKVVWKPTDGVKITYEQHPYHPTAPANHTEPHWHVDSPVETHGRYSIGDPLP
jgi:RHS repeat-associated protein